MKKYYFEEVAKCEMCGDSAENHKVLGQRLDKSQGLSPKKKEGLSVSVKRCSRCHLIYPSPLPIPFDIQDHYGIPPEQYWNEAYFKWTPDYFGQEIKVVKELLPIKPGMKALDVGAGLGKSMLSLNATGFDAYGFEASVHFYERAISKMNISPDKLRLGQMETIEYEPNAFDFITFGAVFEHLYSPATALEKALKWLKPGGIVHIEVPSSKHFIARLINLYYRLRGTNYVTHLSPMHSPFHLYEFDLRSFNELSSKLGCRIEKYHYEVCPIDFVPGIFHPLLRQYMKMTNTGMQLTVYLRKP